MERFPDATITTVLDLEHLTEFHLSWPVCCDRWPELRELPMHIYYDPVESEGWWASQLSRFMAHNNVRFFPVPRTLKLSQRHRMLSAFVIEAAKYVETPWTLKIDTDATCGHRDERFADPSWFTGDDVFIASKWGYTRPIETWTELLKWAATKPELRDLPEVAGTIYTSEDPAPEGQVHTEGRQKVTHGRVISYVQWTRTDFLRLAAEHVGGPFLPTPSQDTFLWYLAERLGLPYKRVRMGRLGWVHGRRKIRPLFEKVFPTPIDTESPFHGGKQASQDVDNPEFK